MNGKIEFPKLGAVVEGHKSVSLARLLNRWLRSRRNPTFGTLYAFMILLVYVDPSPSSPKANWLEVLSVFFVLISPLSDIYMYRDRHRSGVRAILSFLTLGLSGIISQYVMSEKLVANEPPHHSLKPILSWNKNRNKFDKKKVSWFVVSAAVLVGLYILGSTETAETAKTANKSTTTELETPTVPSTITVSKTTVPVVRVNVTATSSPASPLNALDAMIKKMNLKSTPEISISKCGQFTYLIQSDGSHHFYKWSGERWVVDKSAPEEGMFGDNLLKVQMVDATGDNVDDFVVVLPTWDPLKSEPRPLSGAVFGSIDCKWDWMTFRTTYGGSFYQLDNLFWDDRSSRIVAGDEVTNMDALNYDGNRKTKQRFFIFSQKINEFVLASGTPPDNGMLDITSSTIPLFEPPKIALEEASFQCGTKLFDLLDNYNITNLDPQSLAKTWFDNSDYKLRVGKTPLEISEPIISACAEAAKKRLSVIADAAELSCSFSAKDLAVAYGVPISSSKYKIASAVALDFDSRFRTLVIESCLKKME